MKKIYFLPLLLILVWSLSLNAQTVTTLVTTSANCMNDGMAIDADGNLYGSRYGGGPVFKYNTEGEISIFADGFSDPNGLAFDSQGRLYIADNTGHKIYRKGLGVNDTLEVFVDSIIGVSGLLFEHDSDTLIATTYTQKRVYKVTPEGEVLPFLSSNALNGPVGLSYDNLGNLYVANFNNRMIFKVDTDERFDFFTQIPGSGTLGFIACISDTLYATILNTNRIYSIDNAGTVELLLGAEAGDADGDPSMARFRGPNGIFPSLDNKSLYISEFLGSTANSQGRLRLITNLQGNPTTAAPERPVDQLNLKLSPNPTQQWAQLSFQLQESSQVKATLLDQYGKEVRVILPDTTLGAGLQEQRFEVADLSAGLYYCTLEIEGRSSYVERMMIVD